MVDNGFSAELHKFGFSADILDPSDPKQPGSSSSPVNSEFSGGRPSVTDQLSTPDIVDHS